MWLTKNSRALSSGTESELGMQGVISVKRLLYPTVHHVYLYFISKSCDVFNYIVIYTKVCYFTNSFLLIFITCKRTSFSQMKTSRRTVDFSLLSLFGRWMESTTSFFWWANRPLPLRHRAGEGEGKEKPESKYKQKYDYKRLRDVVVLWRGSCWWPTTAQGG